MGIVDTFSSIIFFLFLSIFLFFFFFFCCCCVFFGGGGLVKKFQFFKFLSDWSWWIWKAPLPMHRIKTPLEIIYLSDWFLFSFQVLSINLLWTNIQLRFITRISRGLLKRSEKYLVHVFLKGFGVFVSLLNVNIFFTFLYLPAFSFYLCPGENVSDTWWVPVDGDCGLYHSLHPVLCYRS